MGHYMMLRSLLLAVSLVPAVALAQDTQELTKQYDDGGVYEGSFRGGLQHGQGTYKLPNGYEYTGNWEDGEIKGEGVARFPNGSVYEGAFAKGKPEGFGKITFADGGTFEGEWVDGAIMGQGVALYANGVRYCLLYTSPSPRDRQKSRMPSSA